MGDTTAIAWCDHTFNGWIGCEKLSPACKNCYAAVDTYARVSASRGLPLWGPGSTRHVTSDANWKKPLTWNRTAAKAGQRRRVFAHSLSDVFEDRPELAAPRERLYRLILATPWLEWLLLTKRPENIQMLSVFFGGSFPSNVRLGTTVESQQYAEERIPHLLAIPAGGHFVSCEPLLGPLDLRTIPANYPGAKGDMLDALSGCEWYDQDTPYGAARPSNPARELARIDQVIVGGESAAKGTARPFDPEWARDLLQQCRETGVAFLMKQLGSNPVGLALKHPKGEDIAEFPADLQVQEFPGRTA